MNFASTLSVFGTVTTRVTTPVPANPRHRFVQQATKQIALLEAGTATKNTWFRFTTEGDVLVSLRNGFVPLPLGDGNYIKCPDRDTAVNMLQHSINAAREGQLDELLAATKRVRKSKAAKTVEVV